MKHKKLFATLCGVSLVLMLVALPIVVPAASASESPAPKKELKIGLAWGVTGPWIAYGIPFARCWKLQAKRINEQGGITVGGKKYLIKLIEADTQGRPEGGLAACRKLVFRDKVKFIVGPDDGDTGVAVMPFLMRNKVIMICQGTTQHLISPEAKYSFKAHFPGSLISRAYPAFLAGRYPDIKRIAMVCPDSDAGYSEVEETKTALAEVNKKQPKRLEIVFEDYYPEVTQDFTPILTAALVKKPDVIHLDAAAPDMMALIVKQARELGYKGWFISGGGHTMSTLLEVAGKKSAYNIIHPSFDISKPPDVYVPAGQEGKWKQFSDMFGDWAWLAKAWKVEYGEEMSGVVIYANDALNTIILGILAADSFDTDKVVEALEKMEYVPTYYGMGTWMGKKTWGQNHQIRRPITLYTIQNGKQIPVEPPVLPAYYP